jgi:Domain of unknown function (DUF2437)
VALLLDLRGRLPEVRVLCTLSAAILAEEVINRNLRSHGGILEGDTVTEVKGDPFAGYERTSPRQPLAWVKLLPPVEPRTFIASGSITPST